MNLDKITWIRLSYFKRPERVVVLASNPFYNDFYFVGLTVNCRGVCCISVTVLSLFLMAFEKHFDPKFRGGISFLSWTTLGVETVLKSSIHLFIDSATLAFLQFWQSVISWTHKTVDMYPSEKKEHWKLLRQLCHCEKSSLALFAFFFCENELTGLHVNGSSWSQRKLTCLCSPSEF